MATRRALTGCVLLPRSFSYLVLSWLCCREELSNGLQSCIAAATATASAASHSHASNFVCLPLSVLQGELLQELCDVAEELRDWARQAESQLEELGGEEERGREDEDRDVDTSMPASAAAAAEPEEPDGFFVRFRDPEEEAATLRQKMEQDIAATQAQAERISRRQEALQEKMLEAMERMKGWNERIGRITERWAGVGIDLT